MFADQGEQPVRRPRTLLVHPVLPSAFAVVTVVTAAAPLAVPTETGITVTMPGPGARDGRFPRPASSSPGIRPEPAQFGAHLAPHPPEPAPQFVDALPHGGR
ncbi:hypothetical protein GCM10010206_64760 [Streptomyces cinerochromogenes]|nr:hypothetical protein GCM10010206_64760 [Streptomyces cinerochromogenes]